MLYIGTVGQSVWRSCDDGRTFARVSRGVPSECDVRALLVDPRDGHLLHLGTETGLFVSRDGADNWERVSGPLEGRQIWCLTRDPRRPDVLFAGTCPAGLFRSEDGGATWRELDAGMPERCVGGAPLTPRVTCVHVDPGDGAVFAGVEIGGARRSRDDGCTWDALSEGLSSQDIHGLASVWEGGRRVLLATTNNDVNRSDDDGDTWEPLGVGGAFPWPYARWCAVPPLRPDTVWVGAGNGPPGDQGALFATSDGGRTWERLALPRVANSTIWTGAFHPAEPRWACVASVSGQVYITADGGATWEQLRREFGEVRAVAWSSV